MKQLNISKKKNGSTYLVFDSANENNEVLKKYNELWGGIRKETETINGGKTKSVTLLNMIKIS